MPSRVGHVALDALWLDPGRSGGPETYLRQLAPALAAGFPQTRFTVMTTRRGAAALRADGWDDFASVAALPADEVRGRYGLDGRRLVLSVGAKRPHKNQELLVRAATALPEDVVIMLAGHSEPYEDKLRALIAELGVGDRVRLEGYVPDADLE